MAMLNNQRVYLFTCLRSTNWFTAFPVSKMRDAAIIKNWRTLYPVCFGLCSCSDWPELNATLRRLVEYLFSRQTGRCAMCINMDNEIVEDNLSVLKAMWFPRWGIPTWGEDFQGMLRGNIECPRQCILYIYRYMEFRKSNSYYIYIYIYLFIYIYTCSQVLHLNYSHYLYTDIYAQVNSVSMTSHHPPTTKEGLGVLRQQTQEECVLSQDLFAERRADVSDLTSWIWPVHRCGTHTFAGYAAMQLRHYICNQRHGIEDIYILYIYIYIYMAK